jgi:hypothetical protein
LTRTYLKDLQDFIENADGRCASIQFQTEITLLVKNQDNLRDERQYSCDKDHESNFYEIFIPEMVNNDDVRHQSLFVHTSTDEHIKQGREEF